ncbi:MAG: META domain-containing protein [Actinomycetota bacterium]
MTFRRSLRTLPLISLALVACANAGDGAGTGIGTDPIDLTGVVWLLDGASIAGLVDEVPPGAQVTLTLENGQAHGTAACNSYGGAYRAGDDGSLSFDGFAVTQMGCDTPLMTLESAYLAALGQVTGFGIEGNLVLTGGDVALEFNEEVPAQPLPFVGTTWTLTSIASGDAVSSVLSGTEVTVASAADGTLSGSAGCNRFSGTYTVAGDRLSFLLLATTKMACAGDVMTQERAFLAAMGQVASYAIEGGQLTVFDPSGAMLLGFDGASN